MTFPGRLELLRQRRGALRALLHWRSQRRVTDLLSALALDVCQRATGTGGGFQFVVGELRGHGGGFCRAALRRVQPVGGADSPCMAVISCVALAKREAAVTATIVAGYELEGVQAGTASGQCTGYVVGYGGPEGILKVQGPNRRAELLGLKYSHHTAADSSKGERERDKRGAEVIRITMLVSEGPWRQRVWVVANPLRFVEYLLTGPGDYVAWHDGLAHQWWPGDATMVTLTYCWLREAAPPVG
jgi:hypothetical protein